MNKSLMSAFCLLGVIFLSGCPRVWHFVVTDLSDPSYPSFCLSERSDCRGSGIEFSFFSISEVKVNKDGSVSEGDFRWVIEPETSGILKEVKYGQVPEGWKEIKKAEPLQVGKWYAIHGDHFFRIVTINGKFQAELLTANDFLGLAHKEGK